MIRIARRLRSRLTGAAIAGSLAAAALVVLGPAGVAQAACSNTAGLPAKISITASYQRVNVPLRTNCATISWVGTELYGPQGWYAELWWDPAADGKTAGLDIWGDYDPTPTGSYWTPLADSDAWSNTYGELPYVVARTTVKLGTRAGVNVSRVSGWAHINYTTSRYFTRSESFQREGGVRVDVSYLVGGRWRWISSPTSNGACAGMVSFRSNDPHTYRVCIRERAFAWSSCATQRN